MTAETIADDYPLRAEESVGWGWCSLSFCM
jgi:hypothetical protein